MTLEKNFISLKKKLSLPCILVWILFSLITGFAASAIITTDGDFDTFYNRGAFLPFYADAFQKNSSNLSYDSSSETYTVASDDALFTLNSMSKTKRWKYLTVQLSEMNTTTLDVHLTYLDRDWAFVGEDTFSLESGRSTVPVTSEAFSRIIVNITSPIGTTFAIDKFEFSTKVPADNSRLLPYGLLGTLVCLIITYTIIHLLKKHDKSLDWYAPISSLQILYIAMGKFLFSLIPTLSPRIKKILRITILTGMFCILSFINVYNHFFDQTLHPYTMLFISISLLSVATLYMENATLAHVNWKNPFVGSWFFLWLLSCVSDFFILKRSPYFGGYGYFMLIIIGFLFFVWSNMPSQTLVLQEICQVVEYTFLLCTIYSIFCRPYTTGFRYKGFYTNPNPFGLYLAIVICIFLSEFDRFIKKHEFSVLKLCIFCCGFSSALFFLKETQCTTGVIAVICVIFLWLLNKLIKHPAKQRKRFFQVILILAISYYPLSLGLHWGITNVPHIFDTQVIYPSDQDYAVIDSQLLPNTDIVYASESTTDTSNRIIDKLTNPSSLNDLLSGRLYHYSTYLRSMNLLGHSKRTTVYGSFINYPHNGFLAYAHTYGVYILIPYILMYLYYFIHAIRYLRKTQNTNSFSFLPIAIFIVFLLENMMDNVDTPFHWIVWFIFIFVGGVLFPPPCIPPKKRYNKNMN